MLTSYRKRDCPQLRVDVPPEPESPPGVHPYTVGTPLNPPSPIKLPYPIKLVPRQKKSYFVPHQSFSVVQMFQNPMMLIMVFGGLMMLAMPYIMASHLSSLRSGKLMRSMTSSPQKTMDPEVLQEAQQNQARLRNALHSGDSKSGCVLRRAVPYVIPDSPRKTCLACRLSRGLVRAGPQSPQPRSHRHDRLAPTMR